MGIKGSETTQHMVYAWYEFVKSHTMAQTELTFIEMVDFNE